MIKGINELAIAPVQIDALEMILIRIAYSASLPTPFELLNDVKKKSKLVPSETIKAAPSVLSTSSAETAAADSISAAENKTTFNTVEDLISYLEQTKRMLLIYALKNDVSISEFKPGEIKMTLADKVNNDFLLNLQKVLTEATGEKWKIETSRGKMGETIAQHEQAADEANKRNVADLPLVKAILAEFKGSKIETLTRKLTEESLEDETTGFEDAETYFDEDL